MLHLSASPGLNLEGGLADTAVEQLGNLAVFGGFGQNRRLLANQLEFALLIALNREPAVAVHGFGDIGAHRGRHGKLGESIENSQHEVAVVSGGTGVPKAKFGDSVGVNMLRRAL